MNNNNPRRSNNIFRVTGVLVFAFAVTVVSRPAAAAFLDTTLQQVEWNGGVTANPVLLLQVPGGTNYSAALSTPGCTPAANSIDTLKAFQSIALAALLAGKSVRIYYTVCSGVNAIADVVIYH